VLERILQRSSDKKRANLIKRGNLSHAFDENGTLRTDFLRSLGERVVDGQTDTPGANEAQGAKSAAVDRRYVSPGLYYQTETVEGDLEKIREATGVESKVYSGELPKTSQENYKKVKKALNALNAKGGNEVSLVIVEPNDKYHGSLVGGRTIYMPANKLESGDYAATLVHEFTHFEEGTKEYSKMLDFLSSDEVVVDDGKGGSTILRDRAEAAVLSKNYGVDLEGIRKALDKEKTGEEITAEEAEAIRLYASEVTAHESEMLLGNEAFIDRIVREDGGFAEKIVSRVLSLDKAFAKLGDKEAKAQHKLVRQAERLYLKAAEAAGNNAIQKMILSQVPELEEEVQMELADSNGTKITAGMSDSDRVDVLKNRTVTAPIYEGQMDTLIEETKRNLEREKKKFGKKAVVDIAKKIGISGTRISFEDVNVEVSLSIGNIEESITKEATPEQIAKLLPILQETARDAVVIERHDNRYYYDTDTVYFDSLLGAYIEGDTLIPIRFGLKYSRTGSTTLYVVVNQNEISRESLTEIKKEDRGHSDTSPDLTESESPLNSVKYSIAQIIPFVNSKDLLRYLPDDFLNEGQMKIKKKAVAETEKYTDEKNNKKYAEYVEKGNVEAAKQMLAGKAKTSGYASDSGYQGSLAFNGAAPSANAYFLTKEERIAAFESGDFEGDYSFGDFIDNGLDNNDLEWQLNNHIAASGRDRATLSSLRNLTNTMRQKKRTIKMYRAVDAKIKEGSFRNGDWITPSREYAEQHIDLQDWESGRIIEQEVSIDDIWWNGDDINEWGYDNGNQNEIYKNTKNNVKLAEITYDDEGNLIPFSKRYDENSPDIRFSLKDGANQQTSDDIDELMRSAGIEGDAVEIREDLAELYRKAENLAMDEDATSGKAFVERVANRIALNMARLGTVRDGETQEAMAERLREEILSRSAFAEETEATKEAPKETPKDEPKPKKTGYTYDDVHAMMDAVKKGLTFEMMSGKVVEGKIYRNDAWEVNKKIYHTLKLGELRKKSEVAPTGKQKSPPALFYMQNYTKCKFCIIKGSKIGNFEGFVRF